MPWAQNSALPENVRSVLPSEAQTVFRRVANQLMEDGVSEESAIKQAWAAVKNGWKKPKDGGKWVRKDSNNLRTLYIRRNVLNAEDIVNWAKLNGFDKTVPAEKLHVTIAFSRTPVDWDEVPDTYKSMYVSGGDRQIHKFDKGAVVLKFSCGELSRRWNELCDMGASWDYDDFQPHITLSYSSDKIDLNKITPYEGDIVLGPEVMEEVDDDWKQTIVEKQLKAKVLKVDSSLGLVFGWAIISTIDGEEYFDVQDQHIPEEVMLKAATEYMLSSRVLKEMHVGDQHGIIVFAWPMTKEIANAMGIQTNMTGLMIAAKPDNPEALEKFKSGEYTGFSIGGQAYAYTEVN